MQCIYQQLPAKIKRSENNFYLNADTTLPFCVYTVAR